MSDNNNPYQPINSEPNSNDSTLNIKEDQPNESINIETINTSNDNTTTTNNPNNNNTSTIQYNKLLMLSLITPYFFKFITCSTVRMAKLENITSTANTKVSLYMLIILPSLPVLTITMAL